MKEYNKEAFITFGSGQLREFTVNPMEVLLYIQDVDSEYELRKIVADTIIGLKFCTSYPGKEAEKHINEYGMFPISLDTLLQLEN